MKKIILLNQNPRKKACFADFTIIMHHLLGSYSKFAAALVYAIGCTLSVHAQQEVSVDQFTGTAYAAIPLAAVSIKDVGISVGLTYSADGVKVKGRGTPVGMNWSIGGLPVIRREVRGLPDDISWSGPVSGTTQARYGWLAVPASLRQSVATIPSPPAWLPSMQTTRAPHEQPVYNALRLFEPISNGNLTMYDSEPDIFSYSIAGQSGQFLFDALGNVRMLPYAPFVITPSRANGSSSGPITSFTIRTDKGVLYTFNVQDLVGKHTVMGKAASVQYKIREHSAFYVGPNDTNPYYLTYSAAWHVNEIRNTVGEIITFNYKAESDNNAIGLRQTSWYIANGGNINNGMYDVNAKQFEWLLQQNQNQIERIVSPTATVDFDMQSEVGEPENIFLNQVITKSTVFGTISKKVAFEYKFSYARGEANSCAGASWYASSDGQPMSAAASQYSTRRFLTKLTTTSECSVGLVYQFKYAGIEPLATTQVLPPAESNAQDFWGNFKDDDLSGPYMVPRMYIVPGLNPATVPGAPYRLSDSGIAGQDLVAGLHYQPAGDPSNTGWSCPSPYNSDVRGFNESVLLGTLSEITVPTGGMIQLEYEPHTYNDETINPNGNTPVATGPGPRIKAIVWHDNLTGVNQRRDYRYVTADGKTSGRLLHAPCFAFAVPLTTTNSSWRTATRRASEELAPDPFEQRSVGYLRVTEAVAGRGETMTEFDVPATANDITTTTPAPQGVAWQWRRTQVGIARESTITLNGPYAPGYDGYPFPLNPPLSFRTGRPLKVQVKAEGAGGNTAVVKETVYTYRLSSLTGGSTLSTVSGLAYEILPGFRATTGGTNTLTVPPVGRAYAYARYDLPVDFVYTLAEEQVILNDQQVDGTPVATVVESATTYTHTAEGRIATVTTVNSDGRKHRTRYRYAADYGLQQALSSSYSASLAPLMHRVYTDHITSDVIEVIEEEETPNGWAVASAVLTIFQDGPRTGLPTRPYQVLTRRFNPVVLANAYDNTRIERLPNNAGWDLHAGNQYLLETTVEQVNDVLQPLTMTARKGRTITGQHFSHQQTLPALQIGNAYASEAVFSDFESDMSIDQTYAFQLLPQAEQKLDFIYARTGRGYLRVAPTTGFTTVIPNPQAGTIASPLSNYRFSCWVRTASATSAANSLTVELTPGAGGAAVWTVPVNGTTDWQLVEVPIDLSGILPEKRHNYSLTVSVSGAEDLYIDDALLLPTTATARSTTYDVTTVQKSSETDNRHQTTYYDYNSIGKLAYVRDHNKHIVQEIKQSLAGTPISNTISPDFEATAPACSECTVSNFIGKEDITFTTTGVCGAIAPQLEWNFDDGSTEVTSSATITHQFPEVDEPTPYVVTLTISSLAGQSTITKTVTIYPRPLEIRYCKQGLIGYDCNQQVFENSCSPSIPTTGTTMFVAKIINDVIPKNVRYQVFSYHYPPPPSAPIPAPTFGPPNGASITLAPSAREMPFPTSQPSNPNYENTPTRYYRYIFSIEAPNSRVTSAPFEIIYSNISGQAGCP